MAKEPEPIIKTIKPWIPTNRNIQTTKDRENEERVHVRYLKPEKPFMGFPEGYPEGIIQSQRVSIAENWVRKGLVEIVEVSEVKVVKAKGKKKKAEANVTGQEAAEAETEAARQANNGSSEE